MRVNKGESHRALLVPVLLVIAAAFLATSLGSYGGNDVTGAQVMGTNRCTWTTETMWPSSDHKIAKCPNNRPNVASGGCDIAGGYSGILGLEDSAPFLNQSGYDSWRCRGESNYTGSAVVETAFAYCCR
jgi:hypothetical protein